MFFARRFHKLIEWHILCNAFLRLPYGKEFIAYGKPKKLDTILVALLSKLKIQFKTEDGNEMSREEVAKNVETYCLMS